MEKIPQPVYYSEYLKLDKILNAQEPQSEKYGKGCHDETLFIIIHQTYELWFKQIHHELDSLLKLFGHDFVPERELGTAINRLQRIIEIQKVLIDQVNILETMTPLDFLDFRDFLIPASGFQSVQFRALEIKLGLHLKDRGTPALPFFLDRYTEEDRKFILELDKREGLFQLVEKWLERIPFLIFKGFNFWQVYAKTVDDMLKKDGEIIEKNTHIREKEKEFQKNELEKTRKNFQSLLNPDIHQTMVQEGERHLSQKATLSALFIYLYRDEPILHHPFKILTSLMDIDELLAAWRYRHALMAHRMLGTKIGTGGSSGHTYLKNTTDKNRIFMDLYNLSTFLVPRSVLPSLSKELQEQLGFFFSKTH